MGTEQEQIQVQGAENGDSEPRTLEDPEPHRQLQHIIEAFLIDLECIREMFEVVVPILRQKDGARKARIIEIVDSLTALVSEEEDDPVEEPQAPVDIKTLYEETMSLHDAIRKLNRADAMFHQNVILILVSRYDRFLSEIYSHILRRNPSKLESSEKNLSYNEILQLGSIEEAIDRFVSKEVDGWLRQSHIEKLESLDTKLKLGLAENMTCWEAFVELAERRHIFAHTGGQVTSQYIRVCGENKIVVEVEEGEHLEVDETYFENAYRCLFEIGVRIGQAVWRRLYLDKLESADSSLNFMGYRLLLSEQWDLAGIVFDFALGLPGRFISSDETYKRYLVNRCIALKQSGREKEKLNLLDSVDWSATHPRFVLAVNVLKEEYEQAETVMSSMNGRDPSEHDFLTWPLFRDFRETECFRRAFKRLYDKEYEVEVAREIAGSRDDALSSGNV